MLLLAITDIGVNLIEQKFGSNSGSLSWRQSISFCHEVCAGAGDVPVYADWSPVGEETGLASDNREDELERTKSSYCLRHFTYSS